MLKVDLVTSREGVSMMMEPALELDLERIEQALHIPMVAKMVLKGMLDVEGALHDDRAENIF